MTIPEQCPKLTILERGIWTNFVSLFLTPCHFSSLPFWSSKYIFFLGLILSFFFSQQRTLAKVLGCQKNRYQQNNLSSIACWNDFLLCLKTLLLLHFSTALEGEINYFLALSPSHHIVSRPVESEPIRFQVNNCSQIWKGKPYYLKNWKD